MIVWEENKLECIKHEHIVSSSVQVIIRLLLLLVLPPIWMDWFIRYNDKLIIPNKDYLENKLINEQANEQTNIEEALDLSYCRET